MDWTQAVVFDRDWVGHPVSKLARSSTSKEALGTEQMYPLRMTSPVPTNPTGRDVSLSGVAEDGNFYHCKADNDNRLVRASEEVFTRLASDLGIATADHNVIKKDGETYFGSLNHPSIADQEAVIAYVRIPSMNEIGAPDHAKAVLIARLFVFDMFIGNADRGFSNMLAVRQGGFSKIAAIDFADARLLTDPLSPFPAQSTNTVRWQRLLDKTHPFAHGAAEEMLSRIDAVPVSFFEPIFERLQTGWMGDAQRRSFLEFWRGDERRKRVAALGAGLKDGSLR